MSEHRPPRLATYTLGCKVNRYETDAVAQQFLNAGYVLVPFTDEAEVMLLNTCAVTGEAARKSGQLLRRARKRNPQAVLAVMGCHVQLEGDWAVADIAAGTQGKSRIFEAVQTFRQEWARHAFAPEARPQAVDVSDVLLADQAPVFEDFGPVDQQSETRAYIKIQDGCNNFCSYCTIPLARGRVRSRAQASILEEGRRLVARGFREIVLTGIHVCSYGKDLGLPSTALMDLCKALSEIPGLERLRLGSLEPHSVDQAFIAQAAENLVLCPHFHLSLQSGSEATLARMRRRYTPEVYRQAVLGLRAVYGDHLGLTTDVIVGFPGETEEEFEASLAFCEEMAFTRMHVFRYSERAGTAAVRLPDKVPPAMAEKRAKAMQALADRLQQAHFDRLQGHVLRMLVEDCDAEGHFTGYSPAYDPITLIEGEGLQTGQSRRVQICGHRGDRLLAKALPDDVQ